jgi:hypothetical protein
MQAYHQYGVGSRPALQISQIGALDYQPQVIKLTNCLPMFGDSLRTLRLKHQINQIKSNRHVKYTGSGYVNINGM